MEKTACENLKFSICIPSYEMKGRGKEYLERLFLSLRDQSYQNFEVIVSDHSKDDVIRNLCARWETSFSLIYLRYEEHRGNASSNANNALLRSTGDIIYVIHQDDFIYSEQCLEKVRDTFEKNPEIGWCAVSYIHTNEKEDLFHHPRIPYYNSDIIRAKNTIGPPAVVFHKRKSEPILFDEFLIWMNDCEFCYRLHKIYGKPFIIEGTPLVAIRTWPNSVTNTLANQKLRNDEINYSLNKYHLKKMNMKLLFQKIIRRIKYLYRSKIVRSYFRAKDCFLSTKLHENPLTRLANFYRCDKGTRIMHSWEGPRHFYSEYYHKHLDKFRNEPINFLEIGIGGGNGPSLSLWQRYFKMAKIFALDIDDFSRLNNKRVTCLQADQSNRKDLVHSMSKIGKKLDVIIDDGGHYMNQQQISFGVLFRNLKSGGIYFIEDLHTSYWPYNEYTSVYNNIPIDTNADHSNTTLKMVRDYIKNKKITSQFLTKEETEYLNGSIKECILYDTTINKYGPNHLAVFIKK